MVTNDNLALIQVALQAGGGRVLNLQLILLLLLCFLLCLLLFRAGVDVSNLER